MSEKRNNYFSNLKQEEGRQNRQEHKLTFGNMKVRITLEVSQDREQDWQGFTTQV